MFVFIILHYLAEEMTKECVEWIEKNFDNSKYRIVIIDNASPNNSGRNLKEYYENCDYCDIILNDSNAGFAKGNNVGYKFAKEKYNPDFMIIMNNDVILDDDNFIDKIEKIYEETNFHVLGPDVLSKKTNMHQSPILLKNYDKKDVEKQIAKFEKYLKYPHFYYIKSKIAIKQRVRKLLKIKHREQSYYLEKQLDNPVLHGSCYIFSKRYINQEEEAFDSRTYFYGEEYILNYKCCKKRYKMIYDNTISVLHLDGFSTNKSLKTEKKVLISKKDIDKFVFCHENMLASRKILLEILNEDK